MPRGTNTGKTWPRAYILELYAETVRCGFIWVQPLTAADAQSLKMTFYNARRRASEQNASFILPEYHLCTVGEWEPLVSSTDTPSADGRGRMPILYSQLPDGEQLPSIIPGRGQPPQPSTPPVQSAAPQPLRLPENRPAPTSSDTQHLGNVDMSEEEISGFVLRMMATVADKSLEERQP